MLKTPIPMSFISVITVVWFTISLLVAMWVSVDIRRTMKAKKAIKRKKRNSRKADSSIYAPYSKEKLILTPPTLPGIGMNKESHQYNLQDEFKLLRAPKEKPVF
jgi:hypothetical protein